MKERAGDRQGKLRQTLKGWSDVPETWDFNEKEADRGCSGLKQCASGVVPTI